ncbi:alginate export family protein [Solimonas sp. K1W22B-7]|uniref:alginate export family protein n=1 Tax=Solimonas sp. K1W22B-7 TaxID=2303331 RepID=UPI000E332F41|nr:alginate export family protein [Solimonas sp. K1W22B-7]AXQ29645.1 alginate export family protein [Solimonas sp. K1W22B-7]
MARLTAIAVLLSLIGSGAQAADFGLTRWSEDHRDLADSATHATPLDAIKHIPLGDDPGHYLSLGGQLRMKGVAFDAPLFGLGTAGADGYWFQRLNLHGDWHAGPHLRVFAELGDARVHSKDAPPATVDANRSDLQLAFADLATADSGPRLVLRIGRQELAFDSTQRFVALREGPNVRRAYDGARLTGSAGKLEVTAFITEPVEYRDDSAFDDRNNPHLRFSGLRVRRGEPATSYLDAYWYRYEREDALFGGIRSAELREVFGLQSAGRAGRYDWDTEALYQTGEFGRSDIRAWAFSALLGRSFSTVWNPRLALQLDLASGDRQAGDGRLETFNPLFPRGAYFSQSGLSDFSNLVHAGLFVTARPTPRLSLGVGGGHMARQSRADAAYAQPLLPIPRSTVDDKSIGDYLRINASYRCNRHLSLATEMLRYIPASGLRDVGADTADYAELVAKFLF